MQHPSVMGREVLCMDVCFCIWWSLCGLSLGSQKLTSLAAPSSRPCLSGIISVALSLHNGRKGLCSKDQGLMGLKGPALGKERIQASAVVFIIHLRGLLRPSFWGSGQVRGSGIPRTLLSSHNRERASPHCFSTPKPWWPSSLMPPAENL